MALRPAYPHRHQNVSLISPSARSVEKKGSISSSPNPQQRATRAPTARQTAAYRWGLTCAAAGISSSASGSLTLQAVKDAKLWTRFIVIGLVRWLVVTLIVIARSWSSSVVSVQHLRLIGCYHQVELLRPQRFCISPSFLPQVRALLDSSSSFLFETRIHIYPLPLIYPTLSPYSIEFDRAAILLQLLSVLRER